MFETLSDSFSSAFQSLNKKGTLSEQDVTSALREIRISLLEADVALPVVKSFMRSVQRKATGQAVLGSITPGQLVVKIVHDELVKVLAGDGTEDHRVNISSPPATILVVGLQGSGKTTSTAKLAKHLKDGQKKKVLMASLDTRRPAAMEQLAILGEQAEIETLPIIANQNAAEIARRATFTARTNGFDVVLLDTAGRLHIDNDMMAEVVAVRNISKPSETLLVVDGLTGQDAVNIAREFDTQIGVSGVVLTRMEGDGRGGAAFSMKAITRKPIKFIGTGEKLEDFSVFDPRRIAGRILGMGDIVSLVEKATKVFEEEKINRITRRFTTGRLTMNDLRDQFLSIEKIGGLQGMTSMLPGFGKKLARLGNNEGAFRKNIALIDSMTRRERANPKIIQASRKKRIAAGSGLKVSDINLLLKAHQTATTLGKRLGKNETAREMLHSFKEDSSNSGEDNFPEIMQQFGNSSKLTGPFSRKGFR